MSFDLTKTKVLLMPLISKIAFNINGLIIHLTLNIPIEQSLYNLLNLSWNSLNRLTCRFKNYNLLR
jgi:hypothetical protein